MTAQPDWEARVEALEEHVGLLDAQFQAIGQIAVKAKRHAEAAGPAIVLVHQDVKEMRQDLSAFREDVTGYQAETTERLDRMEGTLAEILRRLPPAEGE